MESQGAAAASTGITALAKLLLADAAEGAAAGGGGGVSGVLPAPAVLSSELQRLVAGFLATASVVVVSEIGDKTFFIAALMAAKHPAGAVFGGAFSALALMTVFSALAGAALPRLLSRTASHYACALLFLYFGVSMLWQAARPGEAGAEAEAEAELAAVGATPKGAAGGGGAGAAAGSGAGAAGGGVGGGSGSGGGGGSGFGGGSFGGSFAPGVALAGDSGGGGGGSAGRRLPPSPSYKRAKFLTRRARRGLSRVFRAMRGLLGPVFCHAFVLTFIAEWGDRSQISTVALAVAHGVWPAVLGGVAGHAACTGAACAGGRLLAARVSERALQIAGGALFLAFGALGLWRGPDADAAGDGAGSPPVQQFLQPEGLQP